MKYLFPLLVFILPTVFENSAAEIYRGSKCHPSRFLPCHQERGYIHYNYSRQWQGRDAKVWKIQPRAVSSVIVHVKALQGFVNPNRFIKIVEKGYRVDKQHIVRGTQNHMFTFDEILSIIVKLTPSGQQSFELDFYVGCKVLKGQDLQLSLPETGRRVSSNMYSQWGYRPQSPTCWLIIPWKKSQEVHMQRNPIPWSSFQWHHWPFRPTPIESKDVTQKLSATLQNVVLPPGSYLTLSDILTGQTMTKMTGEKMNVSAFIVDTSNSSTTFNMDDEPSAALFIDLHCDTEDDCKRVSFKFTAYALDEEDTRCTKNKFQCMLHQQNNTKQCGVNETECKAYTKMVNRFFPPNEIESVTSRNLQMTDGDKAAFAFMISVCYDYPGYCSQLPSFSRSMAINNSCNKYGFCQVICELVRFAGFCRAYHNGSVFSK